MPGSGADRDRHVNVGLLRYVEAMTMMDHWMSQRRPGLVGDRLFLLFGPPVVSFDRNTHPSELPDGGHGVDLVAAHRGGYATYHGQGQIIGHLVTDLGGAAPARLIRRVDETVIAALEDSGVRAYRRDTLGYNSLVGVWADKGRKLISSGMRIRNGITSHGIAINIDPDLRLFNRYIICRLPDVEMTLLTSLTEAAGAQTTNRTTVTTALAVRFAASHLLGAGQHSPMVTQPH